MMQFRRLEDHEGIRAGDVVCGVASTPYDAELAKPVPGSWIGYRAGTVSKPSRLPGIYRRRAVLVLGHGGHGKGAFCKLLTQLYGAECLSSSLAALPHIWPALQAAQRYDFDAAPWRSADAAYAQRADNRWLWRELIRLYNTPDKTTLTREILSRADVYDGMRCAEEFAASRHLFDYVVWVDAAARVGTVDRTLTISRDVADLVIDNNGTLDDLRGAAVRFGERLGVA